MVKILIIEDEESLRQALKKGLSVEKDWEISEANDGKKGFEAIQSTHPDLILLDLLMPEVDGITLLREIRKHYWGETARVIILTNSEDQHKMDEAKALGALGFLIKSNWKIRDLIELIKTHMLEGFS